VNAPEQKDVPAFPRAGSGEGGVGEEDGMTLRDYFAAKAMQAILASHLSGKGITAYGNESGGKHTQYIAGDAYYIADAMIAMRNGGRK
jgi:hypothetical protein